MRLHCDNGAERSGDGASPYIGQAIELLAPAGNAAIGRAAIDAGADAVYIGGPNFGARAAAGNSMADIGELCNYAHLFGAKIFLTLNTLLADDEIQGAVAMIWDAYKIGVDAIIIQDFKLLKAALPPIPLHASTQCFNFDAEQVLALQNAGFERVVLERALSISEIATIKAATKVELEVFIHGAICVGFSGLCNLSEHLTGRSGNRGQCAQPCRSNYDLVDSEQRVIVKNEPLLSPRDMNLSRKIGELVAVGVTSLKIEGRLKDEAYVVNIVAHYNEILNTLNVKRTSYGRSTPRFVPDPSLSFNRGFSEWFFDGVKADVSAARTLPGKLLGKVATVGDKFFTLTTLHTLANGDGVAFFANGAVSGVRVNRVDGENIFPLLMVGIKVGMPIAQTSALAFRPAARRTIELDIIFGDKTITATDSYGFCASVDLPSEVELATNIEKATAAIRTAFLKTGDTIFAVRNVEIRAIATPFLPSSALNAMRRELLEKLTISRVSRQDKITTMPAIAPHTETHLMRSRYCILRQYKLCLKTNPNITLPLYIVNNNSRLQLTFNCDACEMSL